MEGICRVTNVMKFGCRCPRLGDEGFSLFCTYTDVLWPMSACHFTFNERCVFIIAFAL